VRVGLRWRASHTGSFDNGGVVGTCRPLSTMVEVEVAGDGHSSPIVVQMLLVVLGGCGHRWWMVLVGGG
jgi:hypothetical protein